MCQTDKYLSICCGAIPDLKYTYEKGNGVCSKCLKSSSFWDKYDNKEYEDGEYY